LVKIRLTRKGAKKKPFYRVIGLNQARRGRAVLEIIGTYDPLKNPLK